jgi:hypothetical protein
VTCYEFSLSEERLLRGLTESASTAGLALGLQAFVTLILSRCLPLYTTNTSYEAVLIV